MNKIKISAKTVEEACTQAMIKLGISSDKLEYNVISEAKKGFLGIGAKQAVIEAWAKADKLAAEVNAFMNTSAKEQVGKLDEKPFTEKPVEKTAKKPEKKKDTVAEKKAEKPAAPKADKKPEKKADKKPAQKPAQNKNAAPKAAPAEKKAEEKPAAVEAKPVETEVKEVKAEAEVKKPAVTLKLEDVKDTPEEFITKVCNAMGLEVTLESKFDETDNVLDINLVGDDMGILIGKRGQTLDSLQYLTGLVVNKTQSEYVRVKLDTENYRERRKETLENLANNISFKVKRTKKPVALEPMNPYERRVIHAALQNDKFVVTRSEGEEPFRHVVVSLKREPSYNGKNKGGKGGYNRNGSYNKGRGGYNKRRESNRDKNTAANTSGGKKSEE